MPNNIRDLPQQTAHSKFSIFLHKISISSLLIDIPDYIVYSFSISVNSICSSYLMANLWHVTKINVSILRFLSLQVNNEIFQMTNGIISVYFSANNLGRTYTIHKETAGFLVHQVKIDNSLFQYTRQSHDAITTFQF